MDPDDEAPNHFDQALDYQQRIVIMIGPLRNTIGPYEPTRHKTRVKFEKGKSKKFGMYSILIENE